MVIECLMSVNYILTVITAVVANRFLMADTDI